MNFKKVNNSLSPETSDTINGTRAKIIPISFWCPQTVKKYKNCQPGSLKKFQFVHCYITVHVLIVLLKTTTSLQCANNILDILFLKELV